MKRFLPITVLAVFAYPAATISCQSGKKAADPQIFWDGGAIPDPVFRTYVLDNFDTDRDGKISRKEADAVLAIDLGRLCAELSAPQPNPSQASNISKTSNSSYATEIHWLNSIYPKIRG